MKGMQDCAIIQQFSNTVKVLKGLAHEEKEDSIAGAMTEAHLELTAMAKQLRTPEATIIKENAAAAFASLCKHVSGAIDARISELEGEAESCRSVALALADIPDEKLVRRFDKYARAIQGSTLRQLQILKELRSLQDSPSTT